MKLTKTLNLNTSLELAYYKIGKKTHIFILKPHMVFIKCMNVKTYNKLQILNETS